ncbi:MULTISPECIES: DKNYY domain-containing protein [unclassified Pseudoalteromonas]|uniref:DKNYY domain-containing protein n=1 Tax=unclassified Pseudoalteromonas TaxID=194690 RepID=UPI00301567A9
MTNKNHILALMLTLLFLFIAGCKSNSAYVYKVDEHKAYWVKPARFMNNKVVTQEIYGADVKSFQVMTDPKFAKDNAHAYYSGVPIPFADGKSFKHLGGEFYADDKHVFHDGKVVKGAKASTFQFVGGHPLYGDSLGKDNQFAYINAVQFYACDLDSLSVAYEYDGDPSYGWSKDKLCVHYQGKKVDDADPDSFEVLNLNYGIDNNHAFYEDKLIVGSDPSSFSTLSGWSKIDAKDNNHCYIKEQKVDCDNPMPNKPTAKKYKSKAELDEAASKLAAKWLIQNRVIRKASLENQAYLLSQAVSYLGDNLLSPKSVKDINLTQPGLPKSFVLSPTGLFSKGYTYVLAQQGDELITYNVFHPDVYAVMKAEFTASGKQISEPSKILSTYVNNTHKGSKCRFQLGKCTENITRRFPSGETSTRRTQYNIEFENGVWIKRTLNAKQSQSVQVSVYDKFGLPVYVAQAKNGALDYEYIRDDLKVHLESVKP